MAERKKKLPFTEAVEIRLQANNVAEVDRIIGTATSEMEYKSYYFEARQDIKEKNETFLLFNVFATNPKAEGKMPIGVFTLQSINDEVILRVPPRSQWAYKGFSGDENIQMGLNKWYGKAQLYDRLFALFLNELKREFRHYGLKVTWYKRLWRVIKELLGIAKAVKP